MGILQKAFKSEYFCVGENVYFSEINMGVVKENMRRY